MNIKITYNWLKEYLDTDADPYEIQKYLSLCGPSIERVEKVGDDYVFDIEVTSNRVDTASVLGIAQEAQAILPQFGKHAVLKLNPREWKLGSLKLEKSDHRLDYSIIDPELCSRFTAVVLSGAQIKKSPEIIAARLEACDIRSINNVIDISNYIMLALGQPTHIFDYDQIKNAKMILRASKPGEIIKTLDGREIKLPGNDIVIEDGSGRIIDLCGIMGGENSMVTETTKNLLLFVQTYNKRNIRKTSMLTGQRSIAATYFEKGLDEDLVEHALVYGMSLLQEHASAHTSSEIFDTYHQPYKGHHIQITSDDIANVMGVRLDESTIQSILENLGFAVEVKKIGAKNIFNILVPSWRKDDIEIKEDIVEEVARVYGYHNLPNTIQTSSYVRQPREIDSFLTIQQLVKNLLKHLGLAEVMNYSMVSDQLLGAFGLDAKKHLKLANTISEEIKYMRTSLVPSLVKNINDNKGKRDSLKFFEIAKIYIPKTGSLPGEEYRMGIITDTNFSDLKGILESIMTELNVQNYEIRPSNHEMLALGIQAQVFIGGKPAGYFGKVKASYVQKIGLESDVYVADIGFSALIDGFKLLPSYKPPLQYAAIKLDYTLQLNKNKIFDELIKVAHKTSQLLVKAEMVDLYDNKLTLRFHFSSPKENITEETAKAELANIVKVL